MPTDTIIEPGGTLGVFGGGQLGRMFAHAASGMGYRVVVYAPRPGCPASQAADEHICADYDDTDALDRFAALCDAVTIEFENIPVAALERVSRVTPLRPGPDVLAIAQDRIQERAFLDKANAPTAPHAIVHTESDVRKAAALLSTPFVIKNATEGYDGRGQARVDDPEQAVDAWKQLGGRPALFEGWVNYQREVSVLVARSVGGDCRTFGPIENRHVNHILDVSSIPADVPENIANDARDLAIHVAEALQLQGLICVEMFHTTKNQLLVNELAPRPHNSGHLTIEAAETSQFQQQVRALCNLPLGSMEIIRPAAMANLLGEHWHADEKALHGAAEPHPANLHDYGKHAPRPGRKMGHLTALGDTPKQAIDRVITARQAITALNPSRSSLSESST